MDQIFSALGLAIIVFASTNVDDLLILTAFFSDRRMRASSVVIGQFLGIGFLATVSVVAALLAVAIPDGWTRLLGLAPFVLGIQRLVTLRKSQYKTAIDQTSPESCSNLAGDIVSVASTTIANGGDNIGATIPLFANQPGRIWFYMIVFTVMTAIWCIASFLLTKHPVIASRLGRYGHIVLPLVLIALGLHILFGTSS